MAMSTRERVRIEKGYPAGWPGIPSGELGRPGTLRPEPVSLGRTIRRHRLAFIGTLIILLISGMALLAPLISPYDPNRQNLYQVLQKPSVSHWLGTDHLGRDLLSRVIYGSRISLVVGFISMLISATLGTWIGLIAGYRGGLLDAILMRITDAFMCFPFLVFVLALAAAMGPGINNIILALCLLGWTRFARIIRGLEMIPEGIHALILSRTGPLPAFARLQATNKTGFLGWDEIRFTMEETKAILQAGMGKRLPEGILAQLYQRTNGWAACLVLMKLNARIQRVDYQALISRVPKEIYNFLEREVFNGIGERNQRFLIQTPFLRRMTAPMAAALTGFSDAGQILNELSENKYLIQRFSHPDPLYQYHPLLQEFLLSRAGELLSREERESIGRRSAEILEEFGHIEDAAKLHLQTENWGSFIQLVRRRGPAFFDQGKHRTLQGWIESVPERVLKDSPWLLYRLGLCKGTLDTRECRRLLERAFHLFEKQGDVSGSLLALGRIVYAIRTSWEGCELLDRYIDWFDNRLRLGETFPNPTIEAFVFMRMALALFLKEPERPDIEKWIGRSLSLLDAVEDSTIRGDILVEAANYYLLVGDLNRCRLLVEATEKLVRSRSIFSYVVVILNELKANLTMSTAQDCEEGLRRLSKDLEIAEECGFDVLIPRLHAQGARWSLKKGDGVEAVRFLEKMETCRVSAPFLVFLYHDLAGRGHFFRGDLPRSLTHGQEALRIALKNGLKYHEALCRLQIARVLYEQRDRRRAEEELALCGDLITRIRSLTLEYRYLLTRARFSMDQGEKRECLESLRRAMELGRKQGYTYIGYEDNPPVLARLCAEALAEGVEVEYAQEIIRKRNLALDPPPVEIDQWPWAVKIFTLGGFELFGDGKPPQFSRKTQEKPLSMLKVLIALGGKEVKKEDLADLLWPEADGDAAHHSFEMTLHRLRTVVGHPDALLFRDGQLTLNPRHCWVDAWAFERILREAEEKVSDGMTESTAAILQKAIEMYRGPFLAGEAEEPWAISLGERLRRKFLRSVGKLGQYWEEAQKYEKAAECYERGLEVDDLAEELYRRLMICYGRTGRKPEALAVYTRCKQILSATFGVEPSPKIQSLYETVRRSTGRNGDPENR